MPLDMPERRKIYSGKFTNSDIWDGFEVRTDDIIVCTPPKCGTTWVQAITLMLIFGDPSKDKVVDTISPWLDCGFRDREEIAARLNAQTHRRCIKTHTPMDGINYSPDATYIAAYRHPMDVHFSMRKMTENMKTNMHPERFPDDVSEGFRMFVEDDLTDCGTDDLTVASIVDHYLLAKKWDHLPNIHLFHYADLTRDLAGQMDRLAGIYDIEIDAGLMAELVDAATFKSMKAKAASIVAREDSALKDSAEFFSTATSNKWESRLSDAEVAAYDARIADLLPKADRDWLEWGSVI
ncbi:MAG: sulfotransferase domain-containing protein [Paracoccaceae bacterium]